MRLWDYDASYFQSCQSNMYLWTTFLECYSFSLHFSIAAVIIGKPHCIISISQEPTPTALSRIELNYDKNIYLELLHSHSHEGFVKLRKILMLWDKPANRISPSVLDYSWVANYKCLYNKNDYCRLHSRITYSVHFLPVCYP